jgi:hypothetical protein
MSKINISFNGNDYSINESALVSAKDDLKNHFSTAMAGSGGLEPITWDGNMDGRVTVEHPAGYFAYVKVSDKIISKDELIGSVVKVSNENEIIQVTDDMINELDNGAISAGLSVAIIPNGNIDVDGMIFPEAGTYFLIAVGPNYVEYIAFPNSGSSSGTPISFDGTTYQVDPTKLATVTDNFVAHLETLKGGSLEPITWDGNTEGKVVTEDFGDGMVFVKVSDKVVYTSDFTTCVIKSSDLREFSLTSDMIAGNNDFASFFGGVIITYKNNVSIDSSGSGDMILFPEAGTYFQYYDASYHVTSLTFPNASSGGTTKLTINGTEYLVDSSKLSGAVADLHGALGNLQSGV